MHAAVNSNGVVLPYNAHFLVDNSAASLDSHIIALSLPDDS